ncbi:MAG TPA: hypothetical protein VNT30_13755 [Stellaceae bacterium]|nr:hypothetical protein [Stellaceae bacterium]
MRVGMVAAMVSLMVGGCTLMPNSDVQEFSVSGSVAAPKPTPFLSTDPQLTAVVAKQYCADSVDTLSTSTAPSDKGDISVAQIRCPRYKPFPSIPYVSEHLY